MTNEWYNNRIGKKLHEEYPHDFSICDIDGLVRLSYWSTRLIVYESKNDNEKNMGYPQRTSLKLLESVIDWSRLDQMSGVFVLRIVDIDNEIVWTDLDGHEVRRTTFDELYNIFSAKDVKRG